MVGAGEGFQGRNTGVRERGPVPLGRSEHGTSGSSRDQGGMHGRPPLTGALLRTSLDGTSSVSLTGRDWFPVRMLMEVWFTSLCDVILIKPLHSQRKDICQRLGCLHLTELEFRAKSTGLFPLARRDLGLNEASVSHVERTSLHPLRPDLHSGSFLPSFLNWSDPSLGLTAKWFTVLTQCLPVHLSGGV